MPLALIEPESDEELFDRDPDALALNAVMTGDVFDAVGIPGFDDGQSVMIVGHPCSIRRGAELVERVPCVLVREVEGVPPYRRWPQGDWNRFFVPESVGVGARAALLTEFVTVDRSELGRERRILTLTPRGIIVLQQRFIHSLSRFVAGEAQLTEASGPVLAEAELERDWVEARISDIDLPTAVEEFDNFMSAENRRTRLREPSKATEIRREVRAGLKEVGA